MKQNTCWLKSLPHSHRDFLARLALLQRRDARLHGARRPTQESLRRQARQLFA